MTAYEQAQRYVAAIPGAVSGDAGHNQTFSVACSLVNGFALGPSEAWNILCEYNSRCQPPWSEKELVHKFNDARKASHDKSRGHLLHKGTIIQGLSERMRTGESSKSSDIAHGRPPDNLNVHPFWREVQKNSDPRVPLVEVLGTTEKLPEPLTDGMRMLLLSAFLPGEGIRIVDAYIADDGKERPNGEGPVFTREDWLQKLASKGGDPNEMFSITKKTGAGIYIAINPLKEGIKDSDVSAFRHALLEFDSITPEEQWTLYKKSNVPATVVIHSGKDSVHAWVRVDAKNRREYDERVAMLYKHFEAYGLDGKNKNPSRLSRLAGARRFGKLQGLLAVNIGAESFTEWARKNVDDGLGKEMTVDTLCTFTSAEDPNCLLGDRWLCKEGSLLVVGQSGIGKSSLGMQIAISLCLGRPIFGIQVVRPLRVLLVQSENDLGDTAEMFQGVMTGMGLSVCTDEYEAIQERLVIVQNSTHTGERFCDAIRRLIDKHQPDIVILDPLLSFIGDDISKQQVCSQFLRNWLNPIAQATGVAWIMMHHTGKPPSADKYKREVAMAADASYVGIGSSELVNWARAVAVLRTVGIGPLFELKLAKRGRRADAKELDGSPTNLITLKHGSKGIHWEQVSPVAQEAAEAGGGPVTSSPQEVKLSLTAELRQCGLGKFLDACPPGGETQNKMAERLILYAGRQAPNRMLAGRSTCKKVICDLVKDGILELNAEGKIVLAKPEKQQVVTVVTTPHSG